MHTSTEKHQLKNFMNFNFKWSSKNFKVKLNDMAAAHNNRSQSLKRNYKSYRLNKIENSSHFASYTKNVKEERVDMATQIATLQTQILNKDRLRLKDRNIIINILEFLTGIFKNVPAFHYIMSYLDRYIFLDPKEHKIELMIMKQKCGFYEDAKVSFRELFDHIEKFMGDIHEKTKEKCEELKQTNNELSDKVFKLQNKTIYQKKKLADQKRKLNYVSTMQKERVDLLQHCLSAKFESIKAKKTIHTLHKENRLLSRTEEEFRFYRMETDRKLQEALKRNSDLQTDINNLREEKINRLASQEKQRLMIENCNQEFEAFQQTFKDWLDKIEEAKTLEPVKRTPAQKRFSSIVMQALQAKNITGSILNQNNSNLRRSIKGSVNMLTEDPPIDTQISPNEDKSPITLDSNISKLQDTGKTEGNQAIKGRESYFLNSRQKSSILDDQITEILQDCYRYISMNAIDGNIKGVVYDLLKVLSMRFKSIQQLFIDYLLTFKSQIEV